MIQMWQRFLSSPQRKANIILVLVIAMFTFAGLTAFPNPIKDFFDNLGQWESSIKFDDSRDAVKAFYEAFFLKDVAKVRKITCQAFGSKVDTLVADGLQFITADPIAKVDITRLSFIRTEKTDNSARIAVTGIIHFTTTNGNSLSQTIYDTNPMLVIKEGGSWKVCPQLPSSLSN
jgi:hypothetical protein